MDTVTDCPSLGALRSHLDHEDGEVARHLDGCDECRRTIVSVADTAGATRRLLAVLDEDVQPGTVPDSTAEGLGVSRPSGGSAPTHGLHRRSGPVGRRPTSARPAGTDERRGRGLPRRMRGRAAAVGGTAAVILLGATVGQPVVAQMLDQFRTEQVRPVAIDPDTIDADLRELDGLAEVVEIASDTLSGDLDDLAAAADLAGVPAPDLTRLDGVDIDHVEATGPVGARVTFDRSAEVPARLHGVVVEVVSPGALVARDDDGELAVARARPLEVTSVGAPLAEVRRILLDEVDLPESLRGQLAAMDDWRTALPIPVPVDTSLWDEVDVAGTPGLAIGQADVGAVVWQDDELVQAVGGERSVDDLLEIAAEL